MHASIFSSIGNWFKGIGNTIGNAISSIGKTIGNAISSAVNWLIEQILELVYRLFYYIDIFICRVLRATYDVMKVFVGMDKATYKGKSEYLLNIFVNDSTISRVFWGMAALGVTITLILTIWSVIKKTFDLDDTIRSSLGRILRLCGTSILLIFSMTFIFELSVSFTNVLMQQVDLIFNNAQTGEKATDITFDDEDYATMARILDTIGDYSLNDSYSNSYNINSCYNDIRFDMQILDNRGFFDFSYIQYDAKGNQIYSWQYVIAQIGTCHDLTEDQPLDQADDALAYAIVYAMDYVTNSTSNNTVLQSYHEDSVTLTSSEPELDAIVFLSATSTAARNSAYNSGGGMYDALRKPYLMEEKSIYSYTQVKQDFYLSPAAFDHLIIMVGGCIIIVILMKIIMDAIARLYNIMLLYIVSPFFIATRPLDEGKRFEQWKDAFVMQLFGIFGTIISLRLFMLVVPIFMGSDVEIAGGGFVGALAKLAFLVGSAYACLKADKLIQGMLAGHGADSSAHAGDSKEAMGMMSAIGQAAISIPVSAVKGLSGIPGDMGGGGGGPKGGK